MSEIKFKIVKNFSMKDLYNAGCPAEIFEKLFNSDMILKNYYFEDIIQRAHKEFFEVIEGKEQWFIVNGFVKKIKQEIKLKPGMILQEVNGTDKLFVTRDGIYIFEWSDSSCVGNAYMEYCKTLEELNRESVFEWEIIKK